MTRKAKHDYLRLMQEESGDLADFVEGRSEDDWNSPSLCRGWRVRDVVSHMAAGHTMSALRFMAAVARSGFAVGRASDRLARQFAEQHSTSEIVAAFRKGTSGRPKGATAFVPRSELFTDHLVHHQDMRRPLGASRTIPEERLLAALDALPKLSSRVGSKARMRGLRVVAEDVDYTRGHGPEVRGPAEALIMALTGRVAAASDLHGEGAKLLARHLQAEETAALSASGAATEPGGGSVTERQAQS